jgi:hypothetical protein
MLINITAITATGAAVTTQVSDGGWDAARTAVRDMCTNSQREEDGHLIRLFIFDHNEDGKMQEWTPSNFISANDEDDEPLETHVYTKTLRRDMRQHRGNKGSR